MTNLVSVFCLAIHLFYLIIDHLPLNNVNSTLVRLDYKRLKVANESKMEILGV